MQVAEILVRRTIRFVFFGGEGKKGPAAKEKSSKVEKKEKKRGKKNIPRRSQRVRDFLSLSLSLSLSLIFFVIFLPSLLFSASSKISCAKKKEKRERDLWLAADDQWGAWIFFLLGFFICRRGKLLFVLFVFFFSFSFHFPTPSRIGCRRRGQTNQEPRFIGSLLWARPMELCQQWETQ